jgi:hypothetical protein
MFGVLTPFVPVKLSGEPRSSAMIQTMFGLSAIFGSDPLFSTQDLTFAVRIVHSSRFGDITSMG